MAPSNARLKTAVVESLEKPTAWRWIIPRGLRKPQVERLRSLKSGTVGESCEFVPGEKDVSAQRERVIYHGLHRGVGPTAFHSLSERRRQGIRARYPPVDSCRIQMESDDETWSVRVLLLQIRRPHFIPSLRDLLLADPRKTLVERGRRTQPRQYTLISPPPLHAHFPASYWDGRRVLTREAASRRPDSAFGLLSVAARDALQPPIARSPGFTLIVVRYPRRIGISRALPTHESRWNVPGGGGEARCPSASYSSISIRPWRRPSPCRRIYPGGAVAHGRVAPRSPVSRLHSAEGSPSCSGVHMYIHLHRDFEWDPQKAAANRSKHGVDFADAVEVFHDEMALTVDDIDGEEQRFVTIGADALNRILVVVYTWRGHRIRIISVRKATRSERRQYKDRV